MPGAPGVPGLTGGPGGPGTVGIAGGLAAQEPPPAAPSAPTPAASQAAGWNSPRALELLARARAARQEVQDDGTLQSYQALTEGHIYFFVDPEEGEQALIRVDQVAVELFWEAPDLVRQRIVGERAETRLPVRDFRYYLDRLTLVQYGFGDEIEVGQGMDVADVPHPLAPPPAGDPAREIYDVRIGESVTLQLPGEPEPLRIHELQVRPRDPSRPGVLGSIFLSAADGQLVRLDLTFTPASYVDPRTDRIRVELDYGLWEGRYWLPNRQEIEVRREVPELDFGVGTIIRAVLRVGNYELNVPIPTFVRLAPPVTQAPADQRAAFSFRQGLFEAMERDGVGSVATRVDPRELQAEAMRLLRNQPPSGLSPVRFHFPDLSSVARADRARGVTLGAGASFRLGGVRRLRARGGWSLGRERPVATVDLDGFRAGAWDVGVQGRLHESPDLGARPAAPGLVSTAGALFLGEDYLDPYRRSGGWLVASRRLADEAGFGSGASVTTLTLRAGVEDHRSEVLTWSSAPWSAGDAERAFRPIRPIREGTFGAAGARLAHRAEGVGAGSWWAGGQGSRLELSGEGEVLAGREVLGVRVEAGVDLLRQPPDRRGEMRLALAAGTRAGDALPQQERWLGGRGTVAGFPFREQGGDTWVVGGLEVARDLGTPWVRVRAGMDAGWAGSSLLAGGRFGVGLVYDLLRVEGARGLSGEGAEWQLLLSVDPLWWNRL